MRTIALAASLLLVAGGARAEAPAGKGKPAPTRKSETLDELVGSAGAGDAGGRTTADTTATAKTAGDASAATAKTAADPGAATAKTAADPGAATARSAGDASAATARTAPADHLGKPAAARLGSSAAPAARAPEVAAEPLTDDNDSTAAAPPPAALQAVLASATPRRPGAYELGALDCRVLDGAGVERLLPKRIVAGEEPDLLCRIQVTQPATVAAAQHTLTLSVSLGDKVSYQQVRPVRVGSVGRRALVFVIPADRVASDEPTRVTIRAQLSAPARPAVRDVKFNVESLD